MPGIANYASKLSARGLKLRSHLNHTFRSPMCCIGIPTNPVHTLLE